MHILSASKAQVVINEFSSSNTTNYAGGTDDWLELYNSSGSPINIGGYFLSDKTTNPTKWQIPGGTILPANGFMVFKLSGNNIITGTPFETNFKLTQMNQEWVVLANNAGLIIDSYQMLIPTAGGDSRGRITDGSNTWGYFTTPTPNSTNNTTSFQGYSEKPVFSLAPGFYPSAQSLSITCNTIGSQIRYTIDGSEPIITSTLYTTPINISNTTVVRARSFPPNNTLLPSLIENNTYFVNVSHSVNVVSVCGNYGAATTGNGTFSPLSSAPNGIFTSIEFFDVNQQFQWESMGDMRRHGNDSWAYPQKGIRFHSQDRYGYSSTIDYPIFQRSNRPSYDVIILKAGASDNYPDGGGFGSFPAHIRDAFIQTFAEKNGINVDTRRYEPCVLYVNGRYWGVYEVRERVDTDYTDFYYNQPEEKVDMLRVWGGMNIDAGSDTAWYNLRDFVVNNNMAIPANYQHVVDRLDVGSFIDYFIYNQFLVNTDVFNWNTHWWRGRKGAGVKWRYVLWDMDNTFDLGQNYTGLPSTDCNTTPCGYEQVLQSPTGIVTQPIMFKKLKENPLFFQQYANRYAYLNNHVFSCNKLIPHLDSLINRITPEFNGQVSRWGGTFNEWQANVQKIRDFINCRCDNILTGLVDCNSPNLQGPYEVCINSEPPSVGVITFDSTLVTTNENCFTYFGGVNISLTAISNNPNYIFNYWSFPDGTIVNIDSLSPDLLIQLVDSGQITAHFKLAITVSNDTSICIGNSVEISASGATSYTWYSSTAPQTPISNQPNIVVNPISTTYYKVVSNIGIDSIKITVNQLPIVDLGKDSLYLCLGDTVYKNLVNTNVHYLWNDGDTSFYKLVFQSGTYSVVAEQNGCLNRDTVKYAYYDLPIINLGNDTLLCSGESLELRQQKQMNVNYIWNTLDSSNFITVKSPGQYTLTATRFLCVTIDSIKIDFETCIPCKAYIPNAVTPNNDGKNDLFEVVFREDKDCNLDVYHIDIYNRWGVLVFSSDDITQKWSPPTNEIGVYNFNITYSFSDHGYYDTRFESGMISVIY
jgi:gliding motility-associated-like protein